MNEFRLSPEAEAELDGIWIRIARESGNVDIANRVLERIAERFGCWRQYPFIGRLGLRSFPADDHVIIHRILENHVVLILHVVHGSREIEALFGR